MSIYHFGYKVRIEFKDGYEEEISTWDSPFEGEEELCMKDKSGDAICYRFEKMKTYEIFAQKGKAPAQSAFRGAKLLQTKVTFFAFFCRFFLT